MRVIALEEAYRPDPASWHYLGKDADRRAALEKARGRAATPLGGLLHEEADRLRGPFLDLIAAQGRGQDPVSWWSGTLSFKAWTASDLFLLACYQAVCLRLACARRAEELAVVVEDPWLFEQLKESLGASAGVRFEGAPSLARAKLAAWALGLARRLRWAGRMALSWLRSAAAPAPALPARDGVLLYSYLLERSLEPGGAWRDHYLPGLAEDLEAAGARVMRCAYADSTGFEKRLAGSAGSVAPLIRYASLSGFWRALLATPPLIASQPLLKGVSIRRLIEREWWHDLSRAGRCAFVFHLDAVRRLLRAVPWKAVVFPWEAQPQERLLVLACREAGVRSVGCQHSNVTRNQLQFFLGQGEADWAPLPDVLLLSGEHPKKILEQGGWPASRLVVAGNRRFAGMKVDGGVKRRGKDALVVLPVGRWHARQLLVALAAAFPNGGEGFDFVIQPHPAEPGSAEPLPLKARLASGSFQDSLKDCGSVIFCATAAGIEAFSRGVPALRYRASALLDVDPLELLDDSVVLTASDGDVGEKIRELRSTERIPASDLSSALSELFAPVDRAAWIRAILG